MRGEERKAEGGRGGWRGDFGGDRGAKSLLQKGGNVLERVRFGEGWVVCGAQARCIHRVVARRPQPQPSNVMNPATTIAAFLMYAALAGLCGAVAMTAVMKLVSRSGWARSDMVIAVGSLFTRTRDTAFSVGLILHTLSAIVFGQLYTVLLIGLELSAWPSALYAGVGFGVFHGLIVSLALCWVVADQHPLEEFRRAGVSVALTHFIGHVAYGAVVGLVIAIAPV